MADKARPTGFLTQRGKLWSLTYSVNALNEQGELTRVRRREAIGKIAEMDEETAHKKKDEFLAKLPTTVSVGMSVREFVQGPFQRDHVDTLKASGKQHYKSMPKHVLAAFGDRKLASIQYDDVQELIRLKEARYSPQTCKHIRNCISAVFRHAIKRRVYVHPNPATDVRMRELVTVKPKLVMTDEQFRKLEVALPSPVREMAWLAMTGSLNRAEILGLKWGRINLTGKPSIADGLPLPPETLRIAENVYLGKVGTVKCSVRERIVPLAKNVAGMLGALKDRAKWTEPDDLVFVSETRGKAANVRNLEQRKLKKVAEELGMPWVSWQTMRRGMATLADQEDWLVGDRVAQMGHSQLGQTMRYTGKDLERRRAAVEAIADRLQSAGKQEGTAA